jgi:hypothetical protein
VGDGANERRVVQAVYLGVAEGGETLMQTYATRAEAEAAARAEGQARYDAMCRDNPLLSAMLALSPLVGDPTKPPLPELWARSWSPDVACLTLSTQEGPVERWHLVTKPPTSPPSDLPIADGAGDHIWRAGGGHYHSVTEQQEGGAHGITEEAPSGPRRT